MQFRSGNYLQYLGGKLLKTLLFFLKMHIVNICFQPVPCTSEFGISVSTQLRWDCCKFALW